MHSLKKAELLDKMLSMVYCSGGNLEHVSAAHTKTASVLRPEGNAVHHDDEQVERNELEVVDDGRRTLPMMI